MIYQVDNMVLDPVWTVLHGSVNDVLVCRDMASPVGMLYTLLVISDRDCVKEMLAVLEQSERTISSGTTPYLLRFSHNEQLCFLFPYRDERKLDSFSAGQMITPQIREQVCVNFVMECLSSPLPFPLLSLVLTQGNVHIEKDNSIYFSSRFDLSALNSQVDEGVCVAQCAQTLLTLLEGGGRRRRSLSSYALIRKKTLKHAYSGFPELYHDIKVTSLPEKKEGIWGRIKYFFAHHKDRIFHILLVLCVIAIILALFLLISQVIFGDIPLLRLFEHSFDIIGTEHLNQ